MMRKQRKAAERRQDPGDAAGGLLRFAFRRPYGGASNRLQELVLLRSDQLMELRRLVAEHNAKCGRSNEKITVSDIVGAALDLAIEHPLAFHPWTNPEDLRDSLAREVYRGALLHFIRHEII